MTTSAFSGVSATRCPCCQGQGEIVFYAGRHGIEDRPANGERKTWPCPRCTGRSVGLPVAS